MFSPPILSPRGIIMIITIPISLSNKIEISSKEKRNERRLSLSGKNVIIPHVSIAIRDMMYQNVRNYI